MKSRYQFEPGGKARILRADHPAVREGRTLMRSRVFSARHLDRILIGGEMNAKIGGLWEKGWPGTRIFTLSLEERATCPRACPQWRSCYGNHQRFTIRVRGPVSDPATRSRDPGPRFAVREVLDQAAPTRRFLLDRLRVVLARSGPALARLALFRVHGEIAFVGDR